MKGTCRGSDWRWGEGSRLWGSGEGNRHFEWPGLEIRVVWGQEVALLSSMARWRVAYPSQTGRPSSGMQLRDGMHVGLELPSFFYFWAPVKLWRGDGKKNLAWNSVLITLFWILINAVSSPGPFLGQVHPPWWRRGLDWGSGALLPLLALQGTVGPWAHHVHSRSQQSNSRVVFVNIASLKVPFLK